jgi:uncharacterized protein YggU (UPF0235/DUF167 family)
VSVRVTPRADRNAVAGVRPSDGALVLRTTAPPVDGAANRACLELVAEALGVRRSAVTLAGGATSRDKRFAVAGITDAERDARLATLPRVEGT